MPKNCSSQGREQRQEASAPAFSYKDTDPIQECSTLIILLTLQSFTS